MSLRVFHMVFVIVTVILSLYVALWGIQEYSQERSMGALMLAVIFLVTAVGLMIYGKKAYGKLKELP